MHCNQFKAVGRSIPTQTSTLIPSYWSTTSPLSSCCSRSKSSLGLSGPSIQTKTNTRVGYQSLPTTTHNFQHRSYSAKHLTNTLRCSRRLQRIRHFSASAPRCASLDPPSLSPNASQQIRYQYTALAFALSTVSLYLALDKRELHAAGREGYQEEPVTMASGTATPAEFSASGPPTPTLDVAAVEKQPDESSKLKTFLNILRKYELLPSQSSPSMSR